jgi:hypothetical protein
MMVPEMDGILLMFLSGLIEGNLMTLLFHEVFVRHTLKPDSVVNLGIRDD